ncbi:MULTISPECIES: hypothetical protein [Pseudomonadati]|uniref:Uncharacterized protein n=1 Tax=Shewanella aestuarii TaxID=1028752 RepID=A0ABT0L0I1_9GAMM|nr:hypothetical protein [Shewanella aestuarii]MCL1116932.1 hypothetical protein [Shewanella aestuarii]GGN78316.1 hypothetical protein GCM10009193_21300 [Shewanella aestuarii]
MVMFSLGVTVLFILLSMLLKFRHVAYTYVIGNIILFIFFAISGQVGGWFVLIYQIPALGPAFLGICIGTPIGNKIRPIIESKLSIIGNKLSARVTTKQASDSALNGTLRTCSNVENEDLLVKNDITTK